jgi:hypothetical protein
MAFGVATACVGTKSTGREELMPFKSKNPSTPERLLKSQELSAAV